MSSTKEQVLSFLEYCEEMKKCKFIMATTKVKGLLKCIVKSSELYNLFDSVTKDFNYPAVKAECMVKVNRGVIQKSTLNLPQTVGSRLAFIFCLLVEFDSNIINFNDFLIEFFPEDGSYYASYHAFCDTVIAGLEEAIMQVFKSVLESPSDEAYISDNSHKSQLKSALKLAITEEMQSIKDSRIEDEDKKGGIIILEQLIAAVKMEDKQMIDALICGYNYFLLYHRCVFESVKVLIQTIAEYERLL